MKKGFKLVSFLFLMSQNAFADLPNISKNDGIVTCRSECVKWQWLNQHFVCTDRNSCSFVRSDNLLGVSIKGIFCDLPAANGTECRVQTSQVLTPETSTVSLPTCSSKCERQFSDGKCEILKTCNHDVASTIQLDRGLQNIVKNSLDCLQISYGKRDYTGDQYINYKEILHCKSK